MPPNQNQGNELEPATVFCSVQFHHTTALMTSFSFEDSLWKGFYHETSPNTKGENSMEKVICFLWNFLELLDVYES